MGRTVKKTRNPRRPPLAVPARARRRAVVGNGSVWPSEVSDSCVMR
jgi:hypothetical protein